MAEFLTEALPPSQELMLIGPSAGHCLPLEQLARFERVSVLEPDPLARQLLEARLRHPRVELEHRDLLVEPLISGKPGLDAVLLRRPRASVLFCNLLGQVPLELSDPHRTRFQAEFRRRLLPLLAGRRWASFHDRWSLERGSNEPPLPAALTFDHLPTDDELGAACFGEAGPPVTVLDHGAHELFPGLGPRRYFAWQLTPRALHVVEAVSSSMLKTEVFAHGRHDQRVAD